MLAGVALGYYAGVGFLKWTEKQDGTLIPIATAVAGGMAGYWIALSIAPPPPTGDIVWVEPIQQVYDHAELEAVLAENAAAPTLVSFYADWCAPCHIEAPDLNEMAISGKHIVVVNVERSPSLAARYDVTGLPTAIVFRNGKEARRAHGLHSKRALEKMLAAEMGS